MTVEKSKLFRIIIVLVLILLSASPALAEDPPVVHAVLFYSPSCPHCHKVINEDFPPLFEQYGEQLQIFLFNTTTKAGYDTYHAAIEHYEIPQGRRGVPTMIVGDNVLVGSYEIPEQFPGIIAAGVAGGGIPWPDLPGLDTAMEEAAAQATQQAAATETPIMTLTFISTEPPPSPESTGLAEEPLTETPSVTVEPQSTPTLTPTIENTADPVLGSIDLDAPVEMTVAEKFERDLTGNTFAVIVLAGMIAVVIGTGWRVFSVEKRGFAWPSWVIPVLSVLGLGVAGYLSFVEVTQTDAVCGPVGDCNTVQQSAYARLFGVLPIGILGMEGYLAIFAAWILQYYGPKPYRRIAAIFVWGCALFGTVFSIYLTFLEPFVIGATCAWCLTSAVIITVQLWTATGPVLQMRK